MKQYFVISHTHWDREWYMPLESFKLRLCDLFDRLLDILRKEPTYIFHMDAQTIVLEDYLDIRPSRRAELERYVGEGRLLVGPWYLQNDFYLVSGEATVRNLLIGRSLAEEFGRCDTAGYAPDQFGNISQLPQILEQFGIDNFIFGRGLDPVRHDGSVMPSEFIWEGADGTRVLAVHMRYWYNNAQRFSSDIDKALLLVETNGRLFDNIATTPYILMMNGVDHLEAQDDLLPILKEINKKLPAKQNIRQETLANYVASVKDYIKIHNVELPIHKGELRQGGDLSILKGTLSSRYYLKSANVRAETMLEQRLEPLYSMLELSGMNGVYSQEHFRYMWKQLLKNHPHDSICGCSRDEVHAHMEDNYARLETTTWDMLNRGMAFAASHIDISGRTSDNYIITLANTTQTKMDRVVEFDVDIPKSDGAAGIDICDGAGQQADFVVLSKKDAVHDGFSPLNLPGNFPVDRYRVSMRSGEVLPFAFKGFIVNGISTPNGMVKQKDKEAILENEYLKINVSSDGTVSLFDKSTGRTIDSLLEIEDTADIGDSYVYRPCENSAAIYGSAFPASVEVLRKDRAVFLQ